MAGFALTPSAQTLIGDAIGGLFDLVQNQSAAGDVIEVGSVSGTV